jgi:NAD(P)-dependent dehydrogenase (short-subunit alcohol dehydrogenase family)
VSASDSQRVALVTGAARGLGLGIVEELLADGWRVCGADIDPVVNDALQAAAADVDPSAALAVVADVSTQSGCVDVVQQVRQTFGRLDALINNAGIGGPSTTVHETDPAEFTRVIGVNLIGPFHMMCAAVPLILEGGRGGAVVNVGSILGQVAEAGSGAYAASKAGLAQLGQAMALELGPQGVRVNTVAPGYMLTAMHEEYMLELSTTSGRPYEETVESLRSSVPLRRHGTPQDVGQVVAWLLSPRASYVTGQTIPINGGILLT